MPYSSLEKARNHIREKRITNPEWHTAQVEYARQYRLKNKHRSVQYKRNRDIKENDTGRKYREMVNNLLLQRDGNVCTICMEILEPEKEVLHIDHILPRCMGGTHEATNLRLVHAACNLTRTRELKTLEEMYN